MRYRDAHFFNPGLLAEVNEQGNLEAAAKMQEIEDQFSSFSHTFHRNDSQAAKILTLSVIPPGILKRSSDMNASLELCNATMEEMPTVKAIDDLANGALVNILLVLDDRTSDTLFGASNVLIKHSMITIKILLADKESSRTCRGPILHYASKLSRWVSWAIVHGKLDLDAVSKRYRHYTFLCAVLDCSTLAQQVFSMVGEEVSAADLQKIQDKHRDVANETSASEE